MSLHVPGDPKEYKIAEVPVPPPPAREDIDFIPEPEKNNTAQNAPLETEPTSPTLDELAAVEYVEPSSDLLPIHPAIDYAADSDPEEAQGLAASIKNRPDLAYSITDDPEYTLSLTDGITEDMAARKLDAVRRLSGKVDPSMFIEGDSANKAVEFSEQDWQEYEATEQLKQLHPLITKAALNPLEVKVLSRDRAFQEAFAIYNNNFGSTIGNTVRGVRSGFSGMARSFAVPAVAVLDNINEANQSYRESVENGGNTLEEEKTNARVAELSQQYNGRIDALKLDFERFKGTDTGVKLSRQIIDLEEERDNAINTLNARAQSRREEDIDNVKSSAELTQQQYQDAQDWIDNTTLFNYSTPDGFLPAVGSAIPQFLSMILAPETAAPFMFTQGFTEAYEGIKSNGGSAIAATSGGMVNAVFQYFLEQTGVNVVGNFKRAAKDLISLNAEKKTVQKLTGEFIKNIGKFNAKNALKVIPEEAGVEFLQGMGSGMVQEAALIADDQHDFEQAIHNFATQTLQQAATEAGIAALLTTFLVPGTVMAQIRRVRKAAYLRGQGEKVAKSFSESKVAQQHPEVAKDIAAKVINQNDQPATTLNQDYEQFELGEEGAALAEEIYEQGKKTTRVDAKALNEILNSTTKEGQNKVLNMMGLSRDQITEHINNGDDMITIDTVDFLTKVAQTDVGEALLNHVAMPNMEQTFAQARDLGKVMDRVLNDVQSAEDVVRKEGLKKFLKRSIDNALPGQAQTTDALVEMISKLFVQVDKDTGDYNYLEALADNIAVEGEGSAVVLKPKEDIRNIINDELRHGRYAIASEKAQRERNRMVAEDLAAESLKRGNMMSKNTIDSLDSMNDGDDLDSFISENEEAIFKALVQDNVIDKGEASSILNSETNTFNDIGRSIIAKYAFIGKLIPDLDSLYSLNQSISKKVTRVAHIVLATGKYQNASLIDDFRQAIHYLSNLKTLGTYGDFQDSEIDLNSNSVKIAQWIMNRPMGEVRNGLSKYLKTLTTETDTKENSDKLISEMITPKGINIPTSTEVETRKTKFKSEKQLQQEAKSEAEEIDNSQSADDIVLGNDYYHVKNAARARGIPYEEILGQAWENAQEAANTFDPKKGDFQKRIINSIYQTALDYDKQRAIHGNREAAIGDNIKTTEAGKNTEKHAKLYDKMNKDISKLLKNKHKELQETFDLSTKGLTQEEIAGKLKVRQGTISKRLDKINSIPEVQKIRDDTAGIATLYDSGVPITEGFTEFDNLPLKDQRNKIRDWFKPKYSNKKVTVKNNDTGMDIIVAMNGIKHTLNKKTQDLNGTFAGLKIIEEQLTTGKKIREEKDKSDRPDILKVHIFENEFIFNGELYSSEMKVREHTDGKRFYDEVAIKKSSRLARDHTQNSELGTSGREDNKIDGNRSPSQAGLTDNGLPLPSPSGDHTGNIPHDSDYVNNNPDEGTTLNQGKRGEIKLYPDDFRAFIKVFKDGKADTVIHEFSHLWLDHVNKLIQAGYIKADSNTGQLFTALMQHYGKEVIDTEFQENFASDFTQYVMDGKAPAPALINSFRVIRRAMIKFYEFFEQKYGKSNLSPEITDVFNRMLATDEEIEYMGKYYEYSPIAESILQDVRTRRRTLQSDKEKRLKKEAMSEEDKLIQSKERYYKKLTGIFKNHGGYKTAIDNAVNAVNEMPVYKAVDAIMDAGRLDYNMIRDLYGKKVADALKRHKNRVQYTDKNGNISYKAVPMIVSRGKGNTEIDLAQIAKDNGFDHADPAEAENMLIQALVNAPVKSKIMQSAKSEARNKVNTQIAKAVRDSAEMLDYDIVDNLVNDKLLLEDEAEALKNAGENIEATKERWQKRLRQARMERHAVDSQARNIIDNSKLSEAIDYKNFRQQLKKAIKDVDDKLKQVQRAQEAGNTDLQAQLLEEAAALQKKRTIAYVAVRHSIQAFHNYKNMQSVLNSRKLIKKFKNINNKYAQSIVDILYTWKLPPVINNETLFRAANVSPDKFGATLILPENAETPLNEVILFNPSELIPNWIKEKNAESVKAVEDGYQNMSYEQFNDISQAIKSLLKAGRAEFTGMKDARIKTVQEATEKFKENTADHREIDPNNKALQGSNNRFKNAGIKAKEGFVSRVKNLKRKLGADFAMMEFIFREMDDYQVGYFTENVFDKFMDAELDYRKRSKVIKDMIEPYLNTLHSEGRRLKRENDGNERFNINGVIPPEKWIKVHSNANFDAHFTAENILALCLNMGNDANLYAIVESLDLGGDEFRGYYQDLMEQVAQENIKSKELRDPDILEAASSQALYKARIEYAKPYLQNIQSMLTDEGWSAIQGIWDSIGTIFPDYQKAFYSTTGRSLPEEQAQPLTVRTANGKEIYLNGGYYPLKYDFKIQGVNNSEMLDAMTTAERKSANIARGINKDATKTRNRDNMGVATVGRMPQLDVSSVLATHIADTVRYSTHAVIANDFDMLLRNTDFKDSFISKFGEEKYNKLARWALRQARPDIDTPKNWFEKKINSLRSINTVAVLGMNAKTAAKQLLSIPLAMNEMSRISGGKVSGYWAFIDGAKEVMRGMSYGNNWHSNGAMDFVREASDYIKFREDDAYNLVLSDFTEKLSLKPKIEIGGKKMGKKEFSDFSFSLIRTADRMAVMPIWLGAFNQMLEINGVVRTENYMDLLNPVHPQAEIIQKCIKEADRVVRSTQPSTMAPDLSHAQSNAFYKLFTAFSTYTLKAFNRTNYDVRAWRNGKLKFGDLMQSMFDSYVLPSVMSSLVALLLLPEEDEPEYLDMALDPVFGQWQATVPFLRNVNLSRHGASPLEVSAFRPAKDVVAGIQGLYNGRFMKGVGTLTNIAAASMGLAPKMMLRSGEQIGEIITQGELDSKKENRKENK